MPQKPKAGRSKSATSEKAQRERFIETARAVGVDESGKEFERGLKKLIKRSRKRRSA